MIPAGDSVDSRGSVDLQEDSGSSRVKAAWADGPGSRPRFSQGECSRGRKGSSTEASSVESRQSLRGGQVRIHDSVSTTVELQWKYDAEAYVTRETRLADSNKSNLESKHEEGWGECRIDHSD